MTGGDHDGPTPPTPTRLPARGRRVDPARPSRPRRASGSRSRKNGRKVVNLRVPIALGRMGIDRIPGLSADNVSRIRRALDEGMTGPILAVDEDDEGNGVRIVLE